MLRNAPILLKKKDFTDWWLSPLYDLTSGPNALRAYWSSAATCESDNISKYKRGIGTQVIYTLPSLPKQVQKVRNVSNSHV